MSRNLRAALLGAAVLAASVPLSAARADDRCHLTTYGVLPITWRGPRATIPVRVNGKWTNAMLDTGSSQTVFLRNRAHDLELTLEPATVAFEGFGGLTQAFISHVRNLQIGNFVADNMDFFAIDKDLGDDEKDIALILGMDVLRSADTEYDLANSTVKMFKSTGDCGSKAMVYWADDWIQADLVRSPSGAPDIRITVALNGKPIDAVIDTGSPTSFVLRSTAERLGVPVTHQDGSAQLQAGGLGPRTYDVWVGKFDSFAVAGEVVRNAKLEIGDVDSIPGSGAEMLLGADFMYAHHIFVSYPQGRVYLTYNGGPVFRAQQPPPDDSANSTSGTAPAADPH